MLTVCHVTAKTTSESRKNEEKEREKEEEKIFVSFDNKVMDERQQEMKIVILVILFF